MVGPKGTQISAMEGKQQGTSSLHLISSNQISIIKFL